MLATCLYALAVCRLGAGSMGPKRPCFSARIEMAHLRSLRAAAAVRWDHRIPYIAQLAGKSAVRGQQPYAWRAQAEVRSLNRHDMGKGERERRHPPCGDVVDSSFAVSYVSVTGCLLVLLSPGALRGRPWIGRGACGGPANEQ